MIDLIIIGAGGHAGVVLDALRRRGGYNILGLLDDTLPMGESRHGFPILGDTKAQQPSDWPSFFVAVGDPGLRERMAERVLRFINVVHPTAIGAPPSYQSDLCHGVYFGAGSVVGPGCQVGHFAIINTGAILEHDSTLGSFSHLCPGVVTGGRVRIGNRTTIGLNASIRDGVTIGHNCTIGMGSVVLHDIPDNSTAYGNPCKLVATK